MTKQAHSAPLAGNTGYLPPERGNTSQKLDVWSLGCVFLEVLVWFHEGKDERADFVQAATNRGSENGLYRHDRQEISPVVKQKFMEIPKKGEKSRELIIIIRRMLNIDVTGRCTAAEVVKDLKALARQK
jgi:serine/threonine protein kinase